MERQQFSQREYPEQLPNSSFRKDIAQHFATQQTLAPMDTHCADAGQNHVPTSLSCSNNLAPKLDQSNISKRKRKVSMNSSPQSTLASPRASRRDQRLLTFECYQGTPPFLKEKSGNLQLFPYQLDGLNWMRNNYFHNRNCILADEMGLGKTVQAICMLLSLKHDHMICGPFLIVCPLTTIPNWCRELQKWSNFTVLEPNRGKMCNPTDYNIVITSYERLRMFKSYFLKIAWQFVVFDEAHKLKNTESRIRECADSLITQRKLLLTGTPLQNSTTDLWSLLHYVAPEPFPDLESFETTYGSLQSEQVVKLLQQDLQGYLLYRKKSQHLAKMPKEEILIQLELTNHQKAIYKAIYEKNAYVIKYKLSISSSRDSFTQMLRKICNHPFMIKSWEENWNEKFYGTGVNTQELVVDSSSKMLFLDKLLKKLKANSEKILIFTQWLDMMDILHDYMNLRKYEYAWLNGSVQAEERQKEIDKFNNDPNCFVFILSTRAGGLGINLVSANHVVIFDSDYNPFNDTQAAARCHRIGQHKKVFIYRLVTRHTYEEYMLKVASQKLGLAKAVLETGGPGLSEKHQNAQDLENMIRYGAYYALLAPQSQEDNPVSEDIDTIIEKSNRVQFEDDMPEDVVSKAFFSVGDTPADINDPTFWEKVLPDYSTVDSLCTMLEEAGKHKFNVKDFLRKLKKLVLEVERENEDQFLAISRRPLFDKQQVHNLLLDVIGRAKELGFSNKAINRLKRWNHFLEENPTRKRGREVMESSSEDSTDSDDSIDSDEYSSISNSEEEELNSKTKKKSFSKKMKMVADYRNDRNRKDDEKQCEDEEEKPEFEQLPPLLHKETPKPLIHRRLTARQKQLLGKQNKKTNKVDIKATNPSFESNEDSPVLLNDVAHKSGQSVAQEKFPESITPEHHVDGKDVSHDLHSEKEYVPKVSSPEDEDKPNPLTKNIEHTWISTERKQKLESIRPFYNVIQRRICVLSFPQCTNSNKFAPSNTLEAWKFLIPATCNTRNRATLMEILDL